MIAEFREWSPTELGEAISNGPGEVASITVLDWGGGVLLQDLTVIGLDVGTDFDRAGGYAWTDVIAKREPPSQPLGALPWNPDLTVALPGRIDGWKVVAGAKLPDEPGQPPHRYVAVVEANPGPGYMVYHPVVWKAGEGFQRPRNGFITSHREAMSRFVQIVAGIHAGSH